MSRSQNDELGIGTEAEGLDHEVPLNGTKPPASLFAAPTNGVMPNALVVVNEPAAAQLRVCGMSVLARLVCGLDRVVDTVYVLSTPACPESVLREVRREIAARPSQPNVVWISSLASAPTDRGLFVVASAGVLDERVSKRITAVPGYPDKILQFRRSGERPFMWYVGARHAADVLGQLAGKADAGRLLPSILERQATADVDPGREVCDRVAEELTRRAAEERLFAQARKASDTWIARNFDRHVSIWMTRHLVPFSVTPNQVTIIATLLGVAGGGFLLLGTYGAQLLGSILLVLSVVIDGCDGEVARLKYLESDFGRRLDFFLDNVVNTIGIFACSAGHYLQGGPAFYLYASYINAGAALASVLPVYWLFFRENKPAYSPEQAAPPARGFDATNFAENIAGRDFVYLIFALALVGRAYWIAYISLVGAPAFLGFVIYLNVRRWRAGSPA